MQSEASGLCNWLLITDHIVEARPRLIPLPPLKTLDTGQTEGATRHGFDIFLKLNYSYIVPNYHKYMGF